MLKIRGDGLYSFAFRSFFEDNKCNDINHEKYSLCMDDSVIITLSLFLTVIGIVFGYYAVLDYDPLPVEDAEEGSVVADGVVLINHYSPGEYVTYIEIESCRTVEGFYDGKISADEGDTISLYGEMWDETVQITRWE